MAVDVVVHKPQAPITVPFEDAAVAVRRDRTVRPPVVAPAPRASLPAVDVEPAPVAVPAPGAEPAAEPEPETELAAVPSVEEPTGPEAVGPPTPADADDERPDRMDAVPPGPVEVVIALGANLGDPKATLRAAVLDVDRITGLELTEVAPLARTEAVGGPDQPDYLNTVVLGRTTLAARDLLHACQRVEQRHGRVRDEHWGPRTLDVDIITYGTLVGSSADLELPHPRAHERAFVLEPWAHVAPDAVLPGLGGGGVEALAATAPDSDGIRWLALDWLEEPAGSAEQPPAIEVGSSPGPADGDSRSRDVADAGGFGDHGSDDHREFDDHGSGEQGSGDHQGIGGPADLDEQGSGEHGTSEDGAGPDALDGDHAGDPEDGRAVAPAVDGPEDAATYPDGEPQAGAGSDEQTARTVPPPPSTLG
ncbi:2-amino-4-hydroxy-6-hydroxymethyldihydropteridine diphosphokinase [Paraoerskovia sediminicola]|uniref:2-amino-4-hydroxy-6- hydroxymethyldihydropteridine diphosphokinase n=1 Tax=Paraoerskovia sediminicola TaxID=1138587 RepID=UPI003306519C